jgi:hypothetical protein
MLNDAVMRTESGSPGCVYFSLFPPRYGRIGRSRNMKMSNFWSAMNAPTTPMMSARRDHRIRQRSSSRCSRNGISALVVFSVVMSARARRR